MVMYKNEKLEELIKCHKQISKMVEGTSDAVRYITSGINAINELDYTDPQLEGKVSLDRIMLPKAYGAFLVQPASITLSGKPTVEMDFKVPFTFGELDTSAPDVEFTIAEWDNSWATILDNFKRGANTSDYIPVARQNTTLSVYFATDGNAALGVYKGNVNYDDFVLSPVVGIGMNLRKSNSYFHTNVDDYLDLAWLKVLQAGASPGSSNS